MYLKYDRKDIVNPRDLDKTPFKKDKIMYIMNTTIEELTEIIENETLGEYDVIIDKTTTLNRKLILFLSKKFPQKEFFISGDVGVQETTLYDKGEAIKFVKNVMLLRKDGKDIKFKDGSSIENAIKASIKIDDFVKNIANARIGGKRLSPLEKYICAYMFVSNFVYNEEDIETEKASTSRNLVPILNGNKIVCVGYAKMLKEICIRLDIPCVCQVLFGGESGHENNLVKLKDAKYNLDSIFYSDACWDSKTSYCSSSFDFAFLRYVDIIKYDPRICVDFEGSFDKLYEEEFEQLSKKEKQLSQKAKRIDENKSIAELDEMQRLIEYVRKKYQEYPNIPDEGEQASEEEISTDSLYMYLLLKERENCYNEIDNIFKKAEQCHIPKKIIEKTVEKISELIYEQVDHAILINNEYDLVSSKFKKLVEALQQEKDIYINDFYNTESTMDIEQISLKTFYKALLTVVEALEDDEYINNIFGGDFRKHVGRVWARTLIFASSLKEKGVDNSFINECVDFYVKKCKEKEQEEAKKEVRRETEQDSSLHY